MNKILDSLRKYISPLFNTKAASIYILLFAASIAIATFIENDFGTSAAQKLIFKSWWFELLLALFSATLVITIFRYRLIQQRKWALLLFHAAIVVILIGAGITRYFGFEGIMHIRQNESSDSFLSSNSYLKFSVQKNGVSYEFDEPVLFTSLGKNNWHKSYLVGEDLIDVKVQEFIANPKQILHKSREGVPILQLVISGVNGREEYYISRGDTKVIYNLVFNFKEIELPGAINIKYQNDSLLFKSSKTFSQMVMATQQTDTLYSSNEYKAIKLRSLYSDGLSSFVFANFIEKGKLSIESENRKLKSESIRALKMQVSVNNETKQTLVYGSKGNPGMPSQLQFSDLYLQVSYGAKEISLPFSIRLKEFIMDKYPGTNSASSYASEVQLIDSRSEVVKDVRIYMNNILNYKGFRFFQSSFDSDERGTYLSVNHDYWGTLISYIGYFLLTLGMLLTLASKRTRFFQLIQNIKKLRDKNLGLLVLVFMLFASSNSFGQSKEYSTAKENTVALDHARQFSKIVVQDYRGRMKPMHTLSREIMRKVSRKESWYGLTADQILLSMFVNSSDWYTVEIIKLGKQEEIQKSLGVSGTYASYKDFFTNEGNYKLREEVQKAYSIPPVDRGVFEKELLKIDERINIINMIFSGSILRIIPYLNDPNNTWVSTHSHNNQVNSAAADKFFDAYTNALKNALTDNDYRASNQLLDDLKTYQFENGGAIVPSAMKIRTEIFLNELRIFNRLSLMYILLGITFLFFLFLSVFNQNLKLHTYYKVLFLLVLAGFVFHTLGLAMRWYISGRAPWSNGYESMIYIGWTATLSGILFTRKSFGGLAATMVLAGTVLSVSTLSFLDPEITPLVPVLKSYWLTIHVSMEAGSYGFLMLGAIIGLINLILMVFIKESTKDRTLRILREMSYISELTLIGGLFMLSIGTYLGGIWANESWGRYWGWDAKETWALVTILVYSFILHMRLIPKLTGLFAFNFATLFGLASVLMTYYGVNYYLSGLHSYASGDPIPIPGWVYILAISLLIIASLAYLKKRKYKLSL